jgi:hypothetical protein
MKRCQSRRLPGRGDRVLGLLQERAHRSLDALSELFAIFDGLYELAGNPTKPVTAADIAQTRRSVRELTKVGERDIHEVVLSCTRARRQLLTSVHTQYPATDRDSWRRPSSCPWFSDQLVDQVDVVDVFLINA